MTYSVNTVFGQIGEALGKRDDGATTCAASASTASPPLDYPADEMLASGERLERQAAADRRATASTSAAWRSARTSSRSRRCRWRWSSAAVANGGMLMAPHLTDRIVDPDGRT